MTQKEIRLFKEHENSYSIKEKLENKKVVLKEEQREILLLIGSEQLEQTVTDIQIVRECLNKHDTITVIAEMMDRTEEYILLIAMNIPSSSLEDDITIARRIMAG